MTSEQLKNSILQFAVQGKLVPQNPHDEPASELLKKIKVEKEKLIKEKVIKKDKPSLPITEEYKPFEIPDSWEWVRLSEIVNYSMGKTPPRKESKYWGEASYKWVSIADLISDSVVNNTKECVNEYSFVNIFQKRIIPKGTLLMSFKLTVGKVSILGVDAFHNEAIISIFPFIDINKITTHYLFKCLPLLSKLGDTKSAIKGNTLNSDSLNNLYIPLPPLAEQQRIVAKVEELMPLVDEYGIAELELRKLNTKFPDQLKKSVLQYAVQGKLVPQNLNDEPASILLERIKAEKKQLIKEKKIKQDKPLPEIKEEEIPFEIPDSWVWVRLGDLGIIQTGTTPSTQCPEYFGNEIPFIKPADISFGGINYFNEGLTILGSKKSRVIEKNSILMVCIGGSIGKSYFNDRAVCCNQQINAITPLLMNNNYLYYALCSDYFYQSLLSKATGTATPIINKSTWSELIIPLPPLSEQKLIVEKVEEVLKYCDKLK